MASPKHNPPGPQNPQNSQNPQNPTDPGFTDAHASRGHFPERLDIHLHLHDSLATHAKLDAILVHLKTIASSEKIIMAKITDLDAAADATMAAITDESDKDDAIIKLVNANTVQLQTLTQQLADAIAAGADPAAVQAVLDKMNAATTNALANSAKVLAAINAGTTTP